LRNTRREILTPTAPSCRGSNQRSAKQQSKGEARTHESPQHGPATETSPGSLH